MFVCGNNCFGQLDYLVSLKFAKSLQLGNQSRSSYKCESVSESNSRHASVQDDNFHQSEYYTKFQCCTIDKSTCACVLLKKSSNSDRENSETQTLRTGSKQFSMSISWSFLSINDNDQLVISGYASEAPNQAKHIRTGPLLSLTSNEKWISGIDSQGHLVAWDRNSPELDALEVTEVKAYEPLNQVSASGNSLTALSESGRVGYIQQAPRDSSPLLLYQPIPLKARIKHISCGKEHTLACSHVGLVFSWGTGSRGQLGHGGLSSCTTPKLVSSLEGLTVLHIAAGGWHSAAITDQGDLYTWGWNESGQLGFPSVNLQTEKTKRNEAQQSAASVENKSMSKPSTTSRQCTKQEDGKPLWQPDAGSDEASMNQTQHDETKEHNPNVDLVNILATPTVVDFPGCNIDEMMILSASCGSRHTATITESGELFTWGWNKYGQLGHNDTTSKDAPTLVTYFQELNKRVLYVLCGAWNTVVWTK